LLLPEAEGIATAKSGIESLLAGLRLGVATEPEADESAKGDLVAEK